MTEKRIFDEMWGREEDLRAPYTLFKDWFDGEEPARLRAKQREEITLGDVQIDALQGLETVAVGLG